MNRKSKDNSSISRFFLPGKRKRPEKEEDKEDSVPKKSDVIDLVGDDDDGESDTDQNVGVEKTQSNSNYANEEDTTGPLANEEGDQNHDPRHSSGQ